MFVSTSVCELMLESQSLLRTPSAAAGSEDLPAGPVARQRDVAELLKELIDSASTRESNKRSQFSIPFSLSEDLRIGINGYVLVTEEKRKAYTWFDPYTRRGEEVKVVTEFSDMVSPLLRSSDLCRPRRRPGVYGESGRSGRHEVLPGRRSQRSSTGAARRLLDR